MKRTVRALLGAVLAACLLGSAAGAEGIQACHRVENTSATTTQDNKSQIELWHVETALPEVTEEINGLAEAWAEEIGPTLEKAGNNGKKNSKLDVDIRYSRTGLSWLSFMVQARTVYHQKLTAQRFTTRTYDMENGRRIFLTDIFEEDEDIWDTLGGRVRQALTDYWPDTEPDAGALEQLCAREALEQAEFTLHGMSLVLHYPAEALYPDYHTLMEVTLFYPEIRDMMTEEAKAQTDNLAYYKTCALTFDDGPTTKNTPKVLNALMETGARGTFFVIGNRIKDNRFLVQQEHDEGHAIGSHNWHHGNVNKSSEHALRIMPQKVNEAMIRSIGIPVRYDRVPGGRYPRMVEVKVGWAYIQWSLDTYDWRGRKPSEVLSSVKKKIRDGDIILCHDIKDNTPESTRQIVRYLEEEGYMLLTVDELFAKDGVKLEKYKVYYRCENGDTSIRND